MLLVHTSRLAPLKTFYLLQRPGRTPQVLDQFVQRAFVGDVEMDAHAFTLPVAPEIGDFTNSVFATFQIEPDRSDPATRAVNDADPEVAIDRRRHGLFQDTAETGNFTDNGHVLRIGRNKDRLQSGIFGLQANVVAFMEKAFQRCFAIDHGNDNFPVFRG